MDEGVPVQSKIVELGSPESEVLYPARPLPAKYVEPILYLADRMARVDGELAAPERRLVDELAASAGLADFRAKAWFRELSDDAACQRLDIVAARRGCLVVLALVLKVDLKERLEEEEYLHTLRVKMGAEPVVVPVDLALHRALALQYVAKRNAGPGGRAGP